MPRARAATIAVLAATCLVGPGAGAALGASSPAPERAVEMLNEWRAAVGHAPVAHDPAQSEGCRLHAEYFRLNPTTWGHGEDPSLPGYTPEGHAAAATSDLAYGPMSQGVGPYAWQWAPYHRSALLSPRLARTGFWAEYGIACMGVFGTADRPIPSFAAFPYPTDGQQGVPTAFTCNEVPNPCLVVPGNDGTAPTGTIASVHFNGPFNGGRATIATASVTPDGGAPTGVVGEDGGTPLLDGGLNVIPTSPLSGNTWYTAHVTGTVLGFDGRGGSQTFPFDVRWRFRTGAAMAVLDPALRIGVAGATVTVSSLSPAPVTVTGLSSDVVVPLDPSPGGHSAVRTLRLPPGTSQVCAVQPSHESFRDSFACAEAVGTGRARLGRPLGLRGRRAGQRLVVRWRAVAGAARYRVQVRVGRRAIRTRLVRVPRIVVRAPLRAGVAVRVRGVDQSGAAGPASAATFRPPRLTRGGGPPGG